MQLNLKDLAAELERHQTQKHDFVVPDKHVIAAPDSEQNIVLGIGHGVYPLTEFAHGQLASKIGIPKSYYDRMRETGENDLLVANVNTWLVNEEKDSKLYRTLDGNIRAVLSRGYKIIDNASVLMVALQEFRTRDDVKLHDADLSETHLYVKAVIEKQVAIKPGDMVERGVIIRNSEVGAGAFRVDPYLLRLVCSNGMVGNTAMRRIHLGRRNDIGEIMSIQTKDLEDAALWSGMRDVVRAILDDQKFSIFFEQAKRSTTVPIIRPVDATEWMVKEYGMPKDKKQDLLNYFASDSVAGMNQWGLANAATRLAQDYEDADNRIWLEEIGYKVMVDQRVEQFARPSKNVTVSVAATVN